MSKILISFSAALMLIACSEDSPSSKSHTVASCKMPTDCAPANGSQIEVLCPSAGDEFAPGDTVYIGWRANVLDFTGFVPGISLDNGATWKALTNGSVEADDAGPENQCIIAQVVVPEDGSWTPDGTDLDVLFRVKDYSSTDPQMRDVSESVTILAE